MSSFLRFKSFAERDACEVAVKDSAAAGTLIVGIWEIFKQDGYQGLDFGDSCALMVMAKAIGRAPDQLTIEDIDPMAFASRFDLADGGGGVAAKAGSEAVAFAIQQIQDASIG